MDLKFGSFSLSADLHRLLGVNALGAHEATALYAGRILEALSSVAMEALHLESDVAFANLTALDQTGCLTRPWLDWAHALRRTGNDARHLRRELVPLDGQLSLAFVDRWVEWFFLHFSQRPAGVAGEAPPRIGSTEMHGLLDELCRPASELGAMVDPSPILVAIRAEKLIDGERFEDADQVLGDALRRFPGEIRLKQLRGLWFSRRGAPGDLEAAETLLSPLLSGGRSGDEEFFGILAGVLRRRWRLTGEQALLERAARLYDAGFRASGEQNAWLGTSAAACDLLLGRTSRAVERAGRVSTLLEQRGRWMPDAARPQWAQATQAEALLVAGRLEEAWAAYRRALGRPDLAPGQSLSTREQLADLLTQFGIKSGPEAWLGHPVHPAVRVGVVGHRKLEQAERIREGIREALARIRVSWNCRPLMLVSSLAEGADRLFVEVGREEPFRGVLEAVLPLPRDEYRRDFADPRSGREFDELLRSAKAVRLAPGAEGIDVRVPGGRDHAYAIAARAVVAGSDVLVAVWDGDPARGPGGTGETVAVARSRPMPLAWVHATRPGSVSYENWPLG